MESINRILEAAVFAGAAAHFVVPRNHDTRVAGRADAELRARGFVVRSLLGVRTRIPRAVAGFNGVPGAADSKIRIGTSDQGDISIANMWENGAGARIGIG